MHGGPPFLASKLLIVDLVTKDHGVDMSAVATVEPDNIDWR